MKKITDPICVKCGHLRVLDAGGRTYCRECKIAAQDWLRLSVSSRLARAEAMRLATIAASAEARREPTAFEIFDSVCDIHCIGRTIPRMNPNAGRLRAGESLYPRREVAA